MPGRVSADVTRGSHEFTPTTKNCKVDKTVVVTQSINSHTDDESSLQGRSISHTSLASSFADNESIYSMGSVISHQ